MTWDPATTDIVQRVIAEREAAHERAERAALGESTPDDERARIDAAVTGVTRGY